MKNILKTLFILLLLIITGSEMSFSQSNKDSLFNIINTSAIDTNKIDANIKLVNIFARNENYDSANIFIENAIQLSKEIKSDRKLAISLDNKGRLLRKQGKFDASLDAHFQALEIAKKINDKHILAGINNNIGITYRRKAEDNMALKYHLIALKLAEEINNTKNISYACNSIGIIYTYQDNYDDALPYYEKAMKIAQLRNNMIGVAINLNSIAWIYELKSDYEKAIEYYNKSLEVNQKINNYKGIAICYSDLGKLHRTIGEYQKSLEYYKKAIKVDEEDGDKRYIARSRIYLGEVYADMGNYNQSLRELQTGLNYALQLKTKRLIKDGYEQLSKTYEKIGDIAKAHENYKKAMIYKDSIYNEESSRQIAELQTLYETEKKEKEIELQRIELQQKENQIHQKNIQRNISIGGSIILLIFLIIAIRIYLQKKKVNQILTEQKEEIRSQAMHLNAANKQILKNTKLKELFFANTSHEIRTPVNIIVGFTNLLLNSQFDIKQKIYLKNIKNSGNSLLAIVNDILDYSKIEAGKLKIKDVEFNISRKIKNIYESMQNRANDKNIKLLLDIQNNIPEFVIGDPNRLNQILTNLLTNAIKFTDKGEVNIRARLDNKDSKTAFIEFTVSDTGIGIPKNKLENIFESYSQAFDETSRKFGGTGLGLSIVKKLIDLQDGSISVNSIVGRGSIFTFGLPYEISDGSLIDDRIESRIEKVKEIKKMNILLVDDNAINRALATDTIHLFNDKINIDEAENGKIAIDKLKVKEYDLVLMDLLMPEIDGYEATQIIRNEFKSPQNKIPILGMTAISEDEERKKCLALGMNEYITKPFDPEDLFVKILSLVGDK